MNTLIAAVGVALLSASSQIVEIHNVRIEVGDGTTIEHGHVVLKQGRITAVLADKSSTKTSRAVQGVNVNVIDGAGKVLTPGFIESVTRVGIAEVEAEGATNDFAYEAGGVLVPGFRAADAFNPHSSRIALGRLGGVTDAIVAPKGALLNGSGAWFSLTGDLRQGMPNVQRPAAMFAVIGGESAEHPGVGGARGGAWLKLRQAFADARFYASHRAAVDRGDARPLSLSPLHLQALAPVLERRVPLVIEMHRASDIVTALRFAAAERIRLVVLGGAEAWRVADQLKAAKVPVILKPSVQGPKSFDSLAARDDLAARLHEAGVTVVLSAVYWSHNLRRLRQEAGIAVAYGLPYGEAIRAISSTPAKVFGRGADIGSVRVGKRANLVLWSGDPLQPSSRVERLWIDGKAMSLETRQQQLAERYAAKKPAPKRVATPTRARKNASKTEGE